MTKKITFMLFLTILLFLVIGVASASDDNATDIIQENQDDTPVTADLNENYTNNNEDVLKASNEKADEIKSDSSSNVITSTDSKASNVVTSTSKTTKTKLKIKTYTNYVNKGKKYTMYLVDSKGKAVGYKKLKVTFNGKT